MIAYLTLLVVCGVPMICIEMAAGRVTQSGPIAAIAKLCPLMKGKRFASPPPPLERHLLEPCLMF